MDNKFTQYKDLDIILYQSFSDLEDVNHLLIYKHNTNLEPVPQSWIFRIAGFCHFCILFRHGTGWGCRSGGTLLTERE